MGQSPLRTILAAAAATFLLALALPANGQVFRAYLAADGSDANPCTLPQPCRLLPAALAAVTSGGEIWMLDSANYNTAPVNVAKSVTILAVPGAVGSVVSNAGNAITINTPGVEVVLRNLVIVPLPGTGSSGVSVWNGATALLDRCLVSNLPSSGIAASSGAIVRIVDSTIRQSGQYGVVASGGAQVSVVRTTVSGSQLSGVRVNGYTAGTLTAVDIDDSVIEDNEYGVSGYTADATATLRISVHRSWFARNSNSAILGQSVAGAAVSLVAGNNLVAGNGTGVVALGAGTRVWASGNTIAQNGNGFQNSDAVFESAGNNAVRGNISDVVGVVTVVAPR